MLNISETTRLNINLCSMNGFMKTNGAESRHDSIVRIGKEKYVLIFGYGIDGEMGYDWRKIYTHKPDADELKGDIDTLVNSFTDNKILNGFTWNGKGVYLSSVNQMNFNAAYLLAVTNNGDNLPVSFKIGEENGVPVYHTFNTLEELTSFYSESVAYINKCITDGWAEKDSVDYDKLISCLEGYE